jgi:hypothetical protein
MTLPIIKEELFNSVLASWSKTKQGREDKFIERLKIMQEENPVLYDYLIASHDATGVEKREKTAWLIGAVNMYFLLRSQAESDDLRNQWGQ